jgi:hypothetical protein
LGGTSSTLFIRKRIPNSGIIFAQQEELQPSSLHLNVDKMSNEAFAEKAADPTTPQTILVPIGAHCEVYCRDCRKRPLLTGFVWLAIESFLLLIDRYWKIFCD